MRGGKKNKKKRMIRQMLNWNTDVVLAYNGKMFAKGGIDSTFLALCTMFIESTKA